MFTEGSIVSGKYRIDRVIGQGGMGVVVAATHVHLDQRIALKFLLPEHCGDRAIVERFVREARAVAQLRSEHVCRVSDVGALDSGAPYIVMELHDGADLASMLARNGPVPVGALVDYAVQACLGLAEAHAAQVVHRDLKPANLFLTRRPDGSPLIKILDFGIAKAPNRADFHLTRTAAVMGSPGYMSPEQLRAARDADARSDIWALGVTLYELTSGQPPFIAETITELTLRVAMDPTPPLTGSHVPAGFEQVVHRCLEKDPARRFPDVAHLAKALAPFGAPAVRERARGVARVLASAPAGTSMSSAPPVIASATTTLGDSAGSSQIQIGGRRWGFAIGAAAIVVLLVAFAWQRGSDSPSVTAPPSPENVGSSAAAAPSAPAAPSATAYAAVDAGVPVDTMTPLNAAIPLDARVIDTAALIDARQPGTAPPAPTAQLDPAPHGDGGQRNPTPGTNSGQPSPAPATQTGPAPAIQTKQPGPVPTTDTVHVEHSNAAPRKVAPAAPTSAGPRGTTAPLKGQPPTGSTSPKPPTSAPSSGTGPSPGTPPPSGKGAAPPPSPQAPGGGSGGFDSNSRT